MSFNWRSYPFLKAGTTPLAGWLLKRVSARVLYMGGLVLDGITEWSWLGLRARFVTEALANQLDALQYLARDKDLDRGPTEPDASIANRITVAYDTYATAGHPRELLSNLVAYFSPNAPTARAVSDLSNWDTLSGGVDSLVYATNDNWNWDGSTKSQRGWLIFYTPSFGPSPKWGAFKWGDGTCWGTGANSTQVQALKNIAKKWNPPHMQIQNIIVSQDASLFDPSQPPGDGINPDGLFGRPYKMSGGMAVATRFSNTAFFGGVS